ncbi:unnamed protein product, partial [Symbiodinium sp. CCMP2456]
MALGREGDFTGKLRLPLPETFNGNPADWEEWAWNFKAYFSIFETGAVTLLDNAEARHDEFLDEDMSVTLGTGDVDAEQTAARALFSRKRLFKKFSLPGASRSISLLTQLLDFKFNSATFEQVREVILEYHGSRLLMNLVAQTSANATFQGGASAPMDI